MEQFFDYITSQLIKKLKERTVVVWYDESRHFVPYMEALLRGTPEGLDVKNVRIGDMDVCVTLFEGSFFKVRACVEPFVNDDSPKPTLIYLPGVKRDKDDSVLLELEKAGTVYDIKLKKLARNVLKSKYTDGVIDDLLAPENITYDNIVHFLKQSGDGEASMLKAIFGNKDQVSLLSEWLAKDGKDHLIQDKEAMPELLKLISNRFGFVLTDDVTVSEARKKTCQYVLVSEFRSDLLCEPPESLLMIPAPASKEQIDRCRKVCQTLREKFSESYINIADRVESELGLCDIRINAADLGSIDTFRFEERYLLIFCGELIEQGRYDEAFRVVKERSHSFWLDRDVLRQVQWEACRLMAELGVKMDLVRTSLPKTGASASDWVNAYTGSNWQNSQDGWYQVDMLLRILESRIARMDEEPETEMAVLHVRQEYEEVLRKMAEGFSKALKLDKWNIDGLLHQTHIYSETVQPLSGVAAYFLVDAMRYEMGVELAQRMQDVYELKVRPAVAALPTITTVGMAALMPGASSGFSVVKHKDRLVSRVENTLMPDYTARLRYLTSQLPRLFDTRLDTLLQLSSSKLNKHLENAQLVVIRSHELDDLGESGKDWLARQLMDSVIGNIARGIRKLAGAGIEHFVITADHGYQFSLRKGEDMQIDNPGGAVAEIHRRCWIGHGGSTPSGAVRVTGAELGYDTDLDFIFPTGIGVFKTYGGLSYHHGGISLQELIVPVITMRIPSAPGTDKASIKVELSGYPAVVSNRTIVVNVLVEASLYNSSPVELRIILLENRQQMGQAGMAINAECNHSTGCVVVTPGKIANVAMILTREDCKTVSIVVQNPLTDAVLKQSEKIPVKLGI